MSETDQTIPQQIADRLRAVDAIRDVQVAMRKAEVVTLDEGPWAAAETKIRALAENPTAMAMLAERGIHHKGGWLERSTGVSISSVSLDPITAVAEVSKGQERSYWRDLLDSSPATAEQPQITKSLSQ